MNNGILAYRDPVLLKDTKNVTVPSPSDVTDGYRIHSDGGLIYDPISREKRAFLEKYDAGDTHKGTLCCNEGGVTYTLQYELPRSVTAYDAIPVCYTLSASESAEVPVHVGATAFEDPARGKGESQYDLTLPGVVDLTWEYLGYVGATDVLSNRACVCADPTKDRQAKQYPQYQTTALTYSGSVKNYGTLWWKFRYTNTGNTVLDGDGNGTFCFEGLLYRKNDAGEWEKLKPMANLFSRIIDEVYPGESGEIYFTPDTILNPVPGEYKIVINGLVRNETADPENYTTKIWGGETYTTSEFYFEMVEEDLLTYPAPIVKTYIKTPAERNAWLHSYEEFMTSFQSHLKGVPTQGISETMYLQCAPWTKRIVLRMIVGNSDTMATVALPIEVDTDSVKVTLNPNNNNYVVRPDGTRFPAIGAQSMADMRGNMQLGPDAAANVIRELMAMQDIGINLINTTAAFEFDRSFGTGRTNSIDSCWFMLDVARQLGLKVEGWIGYPYEGGDVIPQSNALFGTQLKGGGIGCPAQAEGNARNAIWQYQRWGDNYWIGGEDTVVLDVEDTRGWMRVDFNARMKMPGHSKQNFRLFLQDIYGDIKALNRDWSTAYTAFDQIDPTADTTDDHGWQSYKNKDGIFSEWSRPLALLDQFRTLERIQDYKWVLAQTQATMPTARVSIRTEGGNWMSPVDPNTDRAHLRHVYYDQQRGALIPELLARSSTVYAHSDYATVPYTPSEVAELTRAAVRCGIVPMLLPQFDRMRDVAINDVYGNDYTYEYNLAKQTKGAYINTVCSVFEWFRATYENGGVPGILWQDYLCDGYATATQRREIAFFTEKLTEAIKTPEGREWAENFTQDTLLTAGSQGLYTYPEVLVREEVKRVRALRQRNRLPRTNAVAGGTK